MKMTAQEIERLIRTANCSRRDMETILDLAKRVEGVPLDDEGFNDLIDAINVLRGFRRELELIQMKLGVMPRR
jgi:hypothetical protein